MKPLIFYHIYKSDEKEKSFNMRDECFHSLLPSVNPSNDLPPIHLEKPDPPLSDEFVSEDKIPSLPETYEEIRKQLEEPTPNGNSNAIRIRIVTWNQQARARESSCGSSSISLVDQVREYLTPQNKYHVIVFGSQECEHSVAMSTFFLSKLRWESILNGALSSGKGIGDYQLIRSHTLQAIHLQIYVHKAILHLVSPPRLVQSTATPTGDIRKINSFLSLLGRIGPRFRNGNKGGVAISLRIGDTSFCFINSHLSAHQHNISSRVNEFVMISNDVAERHSQQSTTSISTAYYYDPSSNKRLLNSNPLLDVFDHVFWFGDMNFRINGTRQVVDHLIEQSTVASTEINNTSQYTKRELRQILRQNDQLDLLLKAHTSFKNFSEGPLNFLPTYKLEKKKKKEVGKNRLSINPCTSSVSSVVPINEDIDTDVEFVGISDLYDQSKKQRVPSWTDRILFSDRGRGFDSKSNPLAQEIKLLSYCSEPRIKISDHRCVERTIMNDLHTEVDSINHRFFIHQFLIFSFHQLIPAYYESSKQTRVCKFFSQNPSKFNTCRDRIT